MTLALFGGKPVRSEPYPPHNTMIGPEEEREVLEVLRSGNLSGFSATPGERFLGGPKVRALEAAFAEKFGVKYAVATNSASTALHCAIAALGIGPGDEVITSPFTMSATAAAIVSNGATPVFADIEYKTFNLDPSYIDVLMNNRTKAVLTVNLFGEPSWLETLVSICKRRGLYLIEDNAQSPGVMYGDRLAGTIGDIGVMSLNCHKCIQCGEGGIALTGDMNFANAMRGCRNHGEAIGCNLLGGNFRMTELSAAVGLAQLRKLDWLNAWRRNMARKMDGAIAAFEFLQGPRLPSTGYDHAYYLYPIDHVYYLYPMKYKKDMAGIPRELFVRAMRAEGISISAGYTKPTHLLPFYRNHFRTHEGMCPVAERMWREELLTTDICKYPNTEREVAQFTEAVKKIADNAEELRRRG